MGKDNSGKYHPPKGKPSGAGKEEGGLGIHPTDPDKINEYIEITNKYTTEDDQVAANVHVRHPNRNTQKGQDRFKNQQDNQKITNEEQTFTEERTSVVPEELPGVLTKEVFAELANYKADCCVSLFIATHKQGVEVNEHFDPIIFKNALQDVINKLKDKGLNQPAIEKMVEPGYELLRDDAFWLNLSPGMAVFIADGYFKYIKMPVTPLQETVLDSSFYVTPLLPIMTSKEYFYLLVMSKKQVKLFRADAFGIEPIPVEGLPQGMDDAQAPDKDDETTFRTGGRGGTGGANFHGIGGGNNVDDKAKIATYLETADDIIWKQILHTETAPLLLAGVEYLIPIYKSVTDYNHVWDDALTGSYEHIDTPSLYKQAREKMEPYFQQRVSKALENYGNKSATELTSSIVADVIPATYYGRVAQLFVAKGEHVWGTFDEMANELKLHETEAEGGEDLIDNAVEKTIITGGEVFLLEKEKMPADSQIAAVFRY